MVWASGAVGMPATSAGNDPPPPLSGVSRMSEPTTALDLRRATALPGGPVRARYRDHRRRDRTRCAMDGVGKR